MMKRRDLLKALPVAGVAVAIPAVAASKAPEQRLQAAIEEIRSAAREMGCDEFMLVMREDNSQVNPFILDFVPGSGKTKRTIDLV